MHTQLARSRGVSALLLALVMLLAACGGPPTKQLTEAEGALADARLSERCAPEEYQAALKALERAKKLAAEGKNDEARLQAEAAKKLAEKARARAELRRAECEKTDQPAVVGIDPNEFVDKGGDGAAPAGDAGGLRTVYFAYNSSDLTPESRDALAQNAQLLQRAGERKVVLEGHCDKRGSTEYNLALGERRAMQVKQYLKAMGINPDRMLLISYGEEKPADVGEGDDAHTRNRRVEFQLR